MLKAPAVAPPSVWTLLRALLALVSLLTGPVLAGGPNPVIQSVKRSVVAIGTFERTRSPAFGFSGTGFAVGDGSLVATNLHVLPGLLNHERREALTVVVFSGPDVQYRTASVVASDAEFDLALLRLDGERLAPLRVADAAVVVAEGSDLLFTGFPIGSVLGLLPSTHRAMVSALVPLVIPKPNAQELDAKAVRRLSGAPPVVYQLDAVAYPGSSGSPLYDPDSGTVVGVVNSVFVKGFKESALSNPSGIAFAIPASRLASLMRQSP